MTTVEIAALVTEGAKLAPEVAKLKVKSERLDEIKKVLRAEAGGKDSEFAGNALFDGTIPLAKVKQYAAGIARSIPETAVDRVKALAGRAFSRLFKAAPVAKFELACFKELDRDKAAKLVKLLTVPGTARVSFGAEGDE